MRYLYFVLLVSFSTILFSKDNISKAKKIKLDAPVKVDKSKESEKAKKVLKDELREEANKEIKILRKKYHDNLRFIKEDYKLHRDEIVEKFRNKRKK